MADTMSPEQRSRIMAAIRSKNTKPEVMVRRYLFGRGLRYRIHAKNLPGHPDIVLPKYKTIVFVNGCFWHGHSGCAHYRLPSSNRDFWETKITRNRERDSAQEEELRKLGWRVLRVWECEIRRVADRQERLERLYAEITGKQPQDTAPIRAISEQTPYDEIDSDSMAAAAEPEKAYSP